MRLTILSYLKHYKKDTHEGALISQKLEVHKHFLLGLRFLVSQNQYYTDILMEELRPKDIVTLYVLLFRVNRVLVFFERLYNSPFSVNLCWRLDSHPGQLPNSNIYPGYCITYL